MFSEVLQLGMNTLAQRDPQSASLPAGSPAPYGYTPVTWICITFVALHALATFLHIVLACRSKMWWLFYSIVVCSAAETVGWGGRLWSSYDIYAIGGFQIQICCTIFAPTFTLIGVFILLGRLITRLGQTYSRLNPKQYYWTFITADMIALQLQAIGGGIASAVDPFLGGYLMLAGIAFQLFVLTMATLIAAEYFIRYLLDKPVYSADIDAKESLLINRARLTGKLKTTMWVMTIVVFLLFVRAVYRTIELAGGWRSKVMTTEVYFNVFDGAMVLLAQYVLVVFHPGWLLRSDLDPTGAELELEARTGRSTSLLNGRNQGEA